MALRVRTFSGAFEEQAPGGNGIWNVVVYGGRKIGERGEKPSEQDENQQRTQLISMASGRNQTRDYQWEAKQSQNWAALLPRE